MDTEQSLVSSLANLLGVRAPKRIPNTFVAGSFVEAGELWPAGPASDYSTAAIAALARGALNGSSWNWIMLALVCSLASKSPSADASCQGWLGQQKASYGWMGAEIGTRDEGYWYFHLVSALVMFRLGSAGLKMVVGEWLDLWAFWARSGAPICGQRSAVPGLDAYMLVDETADYLRGGPLPGTSPPTIDRLLLAAVAMELAQLRARVPNNPAWKTATPVTFYVAPGAAMVVLGANLDSNTLPVLCGCSINSISPARARSWAPTPPWGAVGKDGVVTRIREQGDGARCVVSGGLARYTSSLFANVLIPVPAGAKVYVLGTGSTAALGDSAPAPLKPLPPPPVTAGTPAPAKTGGAGCMLPLLLWVVLAAALVARIWL